MRWRLMLLAAAALCVGAAVPEPEGYRLGDYRAPVPETVAGAQVVDLTKLQELMQRGQAVLIDVLAAPRRPAGMRADMPWLPPAHEDIPASVWWPDIGRGAIAPALDAALRARLQVISAAHPGGLIVFYCKSECWLSWNAAKRAASYGVNAGWLPAGADGWAAAGRPLATATPEFLDQSPEDLSDNDRRD